MVPSWDHTPTYPLRCKRTAPLLFHQHPLPFQHIRRIVAAMTRETIIASTHAAPISGASLSRGLLLLTRF